MYDMNSALADDDIDEDSSSLRLVLEVR